MLRNGKLSLAAMIGDGRTIALPAARRAIGGLLNAKFIVVGTITQLLVFPALHE
jgi:hypothetical protein